MEAEAMLPNLSVWEWGKIISFLDHTSKMACRLVCKELESYIDFCGLDIQFPDSNIKEEEKKKWNTFISTPGIYLKKVTLNSVDPIQPNHIGSLPSVGIGELNILCPIGMNFLSKNWDWIVKLVLGPEIFSWDLAALGKEPPAYMPRLQTLHLLAKKTIGELGTNSEYEANVGKFQELMRKIISPVLNDMCINFNLGLSEQSITMFYLALGKMIKDHLKTLTRLAVKIPNSKRLEAPTAPPPGFFSDQPLRQGFQTKLKVVDLDFLSVCNQHTSAWLELLRSSKELCGLKASPEVGDCDVSDLFGRDDSVGFMRQLTECKLQNLRHILVKGIWSQDPYVGVVLDCEIFSKCLQLCTLSLEIAHIKEVTHLDYLPSSHLEFLSLKNSPCFGMEELIGFPQMDMKIENAQAMQKFQNLKVLQMTPFVAFEDAETLLQFSKSVIRLRSLEFVNVSEIVGYYPDSEDGVLEFFQNLTTTTILKDGSEYSKEPDMSITLECLVKGTEFQDEYGEEFAYFVVGTSLNRHIPTTCFYGSMETTPMDNMMSMPLCVEDYRFKKSWTYGDEETCWIPPTAEAANAINETWDDESSDE